MDFNSNETGVLRPRSRRRWWILVIAVLVCVGAAWTFIARKIMGIRSMPPTRIALRHPGPAASTRSASSTAAEDWPRWRGPRGDGISRETNLVSAFSAGGPPLVWAADVGIGYSSPIAAAGRVYLFTLNQGKETLTAFDAATGQILYSDETSSSRAWTTKYPGTRATPVIEGDAIYTYGGGGDLIRRDLDTGKPRWQLNILQTTRTTPLDWGQASSPLIVGERVIVQGGKQGAIAVAVNKNDGTVAWQSEATGVAGYAHPVLADVEGTQQLVIFGGKAVYGMDPATGKTLWQQPWETSYDVNSSTPVYRDGHLFVSSEYNHGCMMLRLTRAGAEKLWENKQIQSKFPGMVLDGPALYANSSGTIKCMSWPDGKILWEAQDSNLRLGPGGSIVRFGGDRLLTLSERGKLSIVRATPEGTQLLSQANLLDSREVWATPLLYAGRLYAKGETEFLCFDLSNDTPLSTRK